VDDEVPMMAKKMPPAGGIDDDRGTVRVLR
jgi:hypothetical protein